MKALKSDKCKQEVEDGTLNSKTLTIVPRKDYTSEEESRDIYQEIVEGFKDLGLTREDQGMLHALGSEEFSVEAMQERWRTVPLISEEKVTMHRVMIECDTKIIPY